MAIKSRSGKAVRGTCWDGWGAVRQGRAGVRMPAPAPRLVAMEETEAAGDFPAPPPAFQAASATGSTVPGRAGFSPRSPQPIPSRGTMSRAF